MSAQVTVKEIAEGGGALAAGPFGSAVSAKYFGSSGMPMIRGSNLSTDIGLPLVEEGFVYLPDEVVRKFPRAQAQGGDLVFTCWGTIEQVGWIHPNSLHQRYLISNKQMLLRPSPTVADSRYLYYYFSSDVGQAQIRERRIGSSIPGFNLTALKSISVPLPDLNQQREIARTLGVLDDKIELNRKTAATLEEMARALYRSWFVDFDPVRARAEGRAPAHMNAATAALFPDSFGEEGLPVGWMMKSYSDLIEILSGGTPKTSEPRFWGGSIPWYSVVDAPTAGQIFVHTTEKTITAEGLRNSPARIVPCGTTILSARGTVGKIAMAPSDMTFNQSCYGLRGRNKHLIAFTYFATLWAVDQLKAMAHGSVFSTITRQTFEGVELPSASSQILDAFEERAECWLSRIDRLGRESRTLADLRDTLLPRLMSGELRVGAARELIDEVA